MMTISAAAAYCTGRSGRREPRRLLMPTASAVTAQHASVALVKDQHGPVVAGLDGDGRQLREVAPLGQQDHG